LKLDLVLLHLEFEGVHLALELLVLFLSTSRVSSEAAFVLGAKVRELSLRGSDAVFEFV
jgi:hypothetical protein